jgi:hypothetical protein
MLAINGLTNGEDFDMMDSAVEALCELIEQGVEWPDATWRITQKYGVDYEKLVESYDEKHS